MLENLEHVKSIGACQRACQHRPMCKHFVYTAEKNLCKLEGSVQRDCDVVHGTPSLNLQGSNSKNE